MFPPIPRQLDSDGQPDAHPANEHDINKVSAQDIICDGERKEPVRSGRYDGTLDGRHRLRKAIRGA